MRFEPTLDVIIECAVTFSVLIKNAERVAVSKILKLNQTVHSIPITYTSVNHFLSYQQSELTLGWERYSLICDGLHELINKVVIFFSSHPFVLQSNVQRIIQKSLTRTYKSILSTRYVHSVH